MTGQQSIFALLIFGFSSLGCSADPVVGSWKGAKQNLSFESDGTLRSLEAAAVAQANADTCETAGHGDEVQDCSTGGWANHGTGYKIKTSNLVVLDGGSRINCKCTHSLLYAEMADANLVLYDHKGGTALDRLSR